MELINQILCKTTELISIPTDLNKYLCTNIMKQHNLDFLLNILQENKNDSIILEKIYQASRDGDRNFHDFCDYQGETVTVIIAKKNKYIFGAYSNKSFNTNENYESDKNSFIFSLTNEKKYQIKNPKFANYNINREFNISFGYPDGILLRENFLSVDDNFAEIWGDCYYSKYPGKRILLAGSEKFQVEDVELFKITRN
jgi:hypothetical protein